MPGFVNATLNCENMNFSGLATSDGEFVADGQILIGGVAAPNVAVSTLTAGAGIQIVNGQNSITISTIGGGNTWSVISANQTLVAGQAYFVDASGGAITLSLPASAALGDSFRVYKKAGANQVTVQCGGSQDIQIGSSATTAGGSLATTAIGDSLEIVCSAANVDFNVVSMVGNFTVV
jgi:hypothetical protein